MKPSTSKTAFVYSDAFALFDYGSRHPLRTERLKLTHDLIRSYGLLEPEVTRHVSPGPVGDRDLLRFHESDYLDVLKKSNSGTPPVGAGSYGIGPGDNPGFPGLLDWSRLVAGGSLIGADLVDRGEVDIAFSIAGGLHHAGPRRASGFCYINDPVLAILRLVGRGRRVLYLDIDAHHGDGVEAAFYESRQVLTVSFHETGRSLFPGTGFETDTGSGPGRGYAVNIPLPAYTGDEGFLHAFREIVPACVERFRPEMLVTQLGVDTFAADPLAHLEYTTSGFEEAVRVIRDLKVPWLALGGGGYNVGNVARAWTLAWAVMNHVEPPDDIPAAFAEANDADILGCPTLRDPPHAEEQGPGRGLVEKEVKRVIDYVKKNVLPLIHVP